MHAFDVAVQNEGQVERGNEPNISEHQLLQNRQSFVLLAIEFEQKGG